MNLFIYLKYCCYYVKQQQNKTNRNVLFSYRHEEIAERFDMLDKDGNGVLSPEEVVSVIRDMMGFDETMARWMVQMFDQNQDGSLDKSEFIEMWTSMFG